MKINGLGVMFLAVALTACGGGGGGDASAPAPAAAPLVLSGTAVKGAPIAGAPVDVKCATGSASATTGADGRFALSVPDGALPCALRVPAGDGSSLYSAVAGSGAGPFTVNISPLTQLVVAQAIGVAPATFFDEFATRVASVTPAALSDAVAAVKTTLAAAGIDLGNIDPLSDALVLGDAQDQTIDALVAALANNNSSLEQLTQTVAANAPVNTVASAPVASGTASLPAALLLRAAAANCAALRSGDYRVVFFEASAAGQYATTSVTVNATTLSIDNHDGGPNGTLIPVGTCRFSNAGGAEFMVSQAGVIAIRAKNDAGVFRNGIAFPEQAHTVAEMVGDWNTLGFERDSDTSSTFHADAASFTIGADGKVTALSYCADVKTCTTATAATLPALTLSSHAGPGGGFDFTNTTTPYVDRIFAYRAGGGELMAVNISGGGSFSVLTRPRTNDLPTIGTASRSFDLTVGSTLLSSGPVSESGNTIKTIDSATGAFTRTTFGYFSNGTVYATWDQSLQANQPRPGYTFRLAETGVPTSAAGVTATNREFVALGLRGMGVSAVSIPFSNSYILSVGQPGGPWLAPELIAKSYAANCSYLRSANYRAIGLQAAAAGQFSIGRWFINAANLTLDFLDGSTPSTLTPNGNCRFTTSGGDELVVSAAGVIAVRFGDGVAGMAVPEQAHTVAELAGTWSKLGFTGNGASPATFTPDAATATVDGNGAVTAISYCADVAGCASVDPATKNLVFAVNAQGGFDRTGVDGTDRFFAYRAGNGDLMLLQISGDGSLGFWTGQRVNALPTVGTRTRNWNLNTDANLVAGSITESANTIASVDSAAGSFVRTIRTGAGASYSETLRFNSPRDGYAFRAAASVSASDGSAVEVREFTSLSMRGMGFSPLKYIAGSGGPASLLISVSQP